MSLIESNGVVIDEDGVPAIKVNIFVEDKIGLGKNTYSSVTVAAGITRYVKDEGSEALAEKVNEFFTETEEILQVERAKVLGELQAES